MGMATPRIISFTELERWDVKYFLTKIKSNFPLVSLAEFVTEHNEKIRPFDSPQESFKILGVNNTNGIFHAYDAQGKDIKQPYKKVSAGDFAYNPYRINVGSIGWVPPEHDGAFISPAYVVFSVDKAVVFPEIFWFILKSAFFNQTLRAATAGSVRMNLTFLLLKTLNIPIPPLPIQRRILIFWKEAQNRYLAAINKSSALHEDVEKEFLSNLGLIKPKKTFLPKLMTISFRDINRWSVLYNQMSLTFVDMNLGKYSTVPLRECIEDIKNGYCIRPVQYETAQKTLKLNALQQFGLDLKETKYIKVSDEVAKRFQIDKDDLLICRSVGSYSHIAKCAIVTEDHPNIIFPDIMIRVKFNKRVVPAYAREVIQSSIGRAWFQQNARTAVGMWKISGGDINKFPMPLPETSIQHKLVDNVAHKREVINANLNLEMQKYHQATLEVEKMICGFRLVGDI